MVTTFAYKPSLVRIDARNFELSWYQTPPPHTHTQTKKQTGPITIHCTAASAQCNKCMYVNERQYCILKFCHSLLLFWSQWSGWIGSLSYGSRPACVILTLFARRVRETPLALLGAKVRTCFAVAAFPWRSSNLCFYVALIGFVWRWWWWWWWWWWKTI